MTENKEFSLDETIKKLENNSALHDKISKDLDAYERNHGENAVVNYKEFESFLNYLASKIDNHEVRRAIVRFMNEQVTRISGDIIK